MEKLHLKNDTYQVWDKGTLWFQGTEQECDKYIAGDLLEQNKIPELSDEEINKAIHKYHIMDFGQMAAFQCGAKWYREQLKSKE